MFTDQICADAIIKHLKKSPISAEDSMRLYTFLRCQTDEVDLAELGVPSPFTAETEEDEMVLTWRDVARELEGSDVIAFGNGGVGVIIFAGRWKGVADPSRGWAQHGVAEAERRVHAWLSNMARFEPDTLRLAAEVVQRGADRVSVLQRHAKELAYYRMGVDHTHGGDGQAARQEAEDAIWRGFRRRIRELAGVVEVMRNGGPNTLQGAQAVSL